MPRPDQSFYLAHFTKNGKDYTGSSVTDPSLSEMSAFERLVNIIQERKIIACELPWTRKKAVCFTECPWGSLLRHAESYSPYGVGFPKRLVYSRNGNPVIYANPKMFNEQIWDKDVYPFVTPFVPSYASELVKAQKPFYGKPVDYTHEREWRVIKDFSFQYNNIAFVILDKYSDLKRRTDSLVEQIGVEKFIFMDTYKKIEELWPTHIMK